MSDENKLDPERVIDAISGTPTVRAAVEALHPFDRRLLIEAIERGTRGLPQCENCYEVARDLRNAENEIADIQSDLDDAKARMADARAAL